MLLTTNSIPSTPFTRFSTDFLSDGREAYPVSVSFEPSGEDQTLLRLVHEQLPESNTYDGHRDGWASILAKLEAAVVARASGAGGTR